MKETKVVNKYCPNVKDVVAITLFFKAEEPRRFKGVKRTEKPELDYAECERGRECGAEDSDCEWAIPFPSDKDFEDYPGIRKL